MARRSRNTDNHRDRRNRSESRGRSDDTGFDFERLTPLLISGVIGALCLPLVVVLLPELKPWVLAFAWVVLALLGLSVFVQRVLLGMATLFAALIVLALFTPMLEWTTRWLDVGETPRHADVIVVLGAGMHCASGDLEAESLTRIERGLELWRQGFADTITLSDPAEGVEDSGCPSPETAQRRLIGRLFPEGGPRIVTLENMRSTRSEALAVARQAKARGWRSVMVVTSPTHTLRALGAFRQAGVDAFAVSSQEPKFDTGFRRVSDRLWGLTYVLRELVGLFSYQWRGWL